MGAKPSCASYCQTAANNDKITIKKDGLSPACSPDSSLNPHGTIRSRHVLGASSLHARKIGRQVGTSSGSVPVDVPGCSNVAEQQERHNPAVATKPMRLPSVNEIGQKSRNGSQSVIRHRQCIPPPSIVGANEDEDFRMDPTPMPKKHQSNSREQRRKVADNAPSFATGLLVDRDADGVSAPDDQKGISSSFGSDPAVSRSRRQTFSVADNELDNDAVSPQPSATSPTTGATPVSATGQGSASSDDPPSRPVREWIEVTHVDTGALGGGCYLQYTDVAGGVLRIFWSKTYPEGSTNVAFFRPAKEPPAFKFKGETRKQDLVKGVQRDKQLLYQGWVSFAKLCKANDAKLTLLDGINAVPPVAVFFVDKKNRVHQVSHDDWFSLNEAEAVAAMSPGADVLTGITTLPPGIFVQMANPLPFIRAAVQPSHQYQNGQRSDVQSAADYLLPPGLPESHRDQRSPARMEGSCSSLPSTRTEGETLRSFPDGPPPPIDLDPPWLEDFDPEDVALAEGNKIILSSFEDAVSPRHVVAGLLPVAAGSPGGEPEVVRVWAPDAGQLVFLRSPLQSSRRPLKSLPLPHRAVLVPLKLVAALCLINPTPCCMMAGPRPCVSPRQPSAPRIVPIEGHRQRLDARVAGSERHRLKRSPIQASSRRTVGRIPIPIMMSAKLCRRGVLLDKLSEICGAEITLVVRGWA